LVVHEAHDVVGRLVVWVVDEVPCCDDVGAAPGSVPAVVDSVTEPAPRVCSSLTPPTTITTRVVSSVPVVTMVSGAALAVLTATSRCGESWVSTNSNPRTAA
jgi:hypothetical protein